MYINPRNSLKIISFFLAIVSLSACSKPEFKVKGEIYGGEDKTLILEKSGFQGQWVPIDSTHINKNGGFSFSFPSPQSPEIYRLVLNDRYIYFPVDSIETITITSSFDKFGNDFSLSGSSNAIKMENFEKDLQKANTNNPDSLVSFKRKVFSNYIKDSQGSIISFYILTKTIDGRPLYSPTDPEDRKYFVAVATGYKTANPNDPHAALLEQTAIQAIKDKNRENGNFQSIEAQEISLIDMDLQNEEGINIKLSDIAGKGKPVVVIFSLLTHQDSPELNMALANIYQKHQGKVEFYNVSLDNDQYAWREAAKNLPWVTVYSPGETSSADAIKYNVFQIPSFYIYNNNGELTSRPMTLEELDKNL